MTDAVQNAASLARASASRGWLQHWPVVGALFALWTTAGAVLAASIAANGGRFVYALDDPYIHMAMAKNIALHGSWAIGAAPFTSSSSSLLWTALLGAVFAVVGVRDLVPLVLNLLAATATLVVFYAILVRSCPRFHAGHRFAVLALLVFSAPMPALILSGQEHVLHLLATVVLAWVAAEDLVRPPHEHGSVPPRLLALAALVTLLRYEGMFLVLTISALYALRRRFTPALVILAAGAAPLVIYGIVSVAHGWMWLPNSVWIKAQRPDLRTLSGLFALTGYTALKSLLRVPAVLFLLDAVLLLLFVFVRRWSFGSALAAQFVPVTIVHMQFAQPPAFWLFRYEAYLVAFGLVTVAVLGAERLADRADGAGWRGSAARHGLVFAIGLLLLVFSPLTDRAVQAIRILPQATSNIHEQQFQMGRFVHRYYDDSSVALNDIGAVGYLSGARCLDLVGLASMDVARLRWERRYYREALADVAEAHDVRIAIVYDHWFKNAEVGGLPASWLRVGQWTIEHPVVVGGPTVVFYATSAMDARVLRANMRDFALELPPGVAQTVW